jgi:hypothetical protein
MNLWTAEQTVKAIIMELPPTRRQQLDPERLEAVVEEQAIQLLEQIQEIEELNRGTSLDRQEIVEVAKDTALKGLQERIERVLEEAARPEAAGE